jgi:hypothetical protein
MMKCLARWSIAPLLVIASGAVCANELSGADIEIVSVLPRSPDVKPIAMSVPPAGHREAGKFANLPRDSAPDSAAAKLASAENPKSAPSPGGDKR